MKPLLAHIYEPHRVTYPCYVQPKLNGIRALYQGGHFQSRDEIPFPTGLLEHLAKPLLATFGPDVILDGELYVHGWPLQRINAAVTPVRQTPTEDTIQVQYHVFDVVDFNKSFSERFMHSGIARTLLEANLNFVETWNLTTEEQVNNTYVRFVSQGYEGMMYRLGDCPYTLPNQEWVRGWRANPRSKNFSDKNNRCWHLLKRKDWQDDEFRCVGWNYGEGKYANMVGALICITPQGKQFTVSGGLTDEQRRVFVINPPTSKLIKVRYLMFSSEGLPLNPTIEMIL
jgi:DNA ligase-1